MKMMQWGAAALALGARAFRSAGRGRRRQDARTVKARGVLNCTGHDGSYLGFAEVDDKGNWKGMDIDLCRAVATACSAIRRN
ncbi:hypothetical protein ACFSQT_02855 [Mesorhizobium calcicola]|uniref:Uncharacterized protein n=1 Tax=Mesorhizobium calcicola TaxID=1300310 RepID=A0ABW4W634_9HYPH